MYTNKINGKRYIGQAKGFNRRYKEHMWSSYNENDRSYNYPLHRAIRKYGIESFEVIVLKYDLKTQCLLNLYESYYIDKYNTMTIKHGYNISDGGSNGNKFAGKTEEEMTKTRKRMSESSMGDKNPMYGKHHSDKIKQDQSNRMKGNNFAKGKTKSEETKQKISEARKGKPNISCRKRVLQYDKDGNFIREWESRQEAAEVLGIKVIGIKECCNGKSKTYKGYVWKNE
jgi:group I intron endonuclease